VVLYAAFIGLLLASYVNPLKEILESRATILALEGEISDTQAANERQRTLIRDLDTPEGIERAARERYNMVRPGEHVYVVEDPEQEE
jgi:cell division protein FtsB